MINIDFERLRAIGLNDTLARAPAPPPRRHGGAGARADAHHRRSIAAASSCTRPRRACRPRRCRACCAPRRRRARRRRLGARRRRRGGRPLGHASECAPTSHIARRDGDGSRHAIVSNVDRALVVMGLDDDFNLRRLERYLALVQASGVAPVVVLTQGRHRGADPARRDAPARGCASALAAATSRSSPSTPPIRAARRRSRTSPAPARRSSCSARRAPASRR